jgi:hypothetical protein
MRFAQRAPLLFAFGCALAACTLSNAGITPPPRAFHYPVAATISANGHWLYVVNSDFNLQYNGGRVNVVDLDAVDTRIANHETSVVEGDVMSPAADSSVRINPFATAAMLRRDMGGAPARLYITVRGDGTLTFLDTNEEHLQCGQQQDSDLCGDEHRVGQVPTAPRNLTLPPLPVTLWVDEQDPFIVVVHQEAPRARASLFFDPFVAGSSPQLVHYLNDLSPNLNAVVRAPVSTDGDAGADADPHFFVFSRSEPTVNQVRVRPDAQNSYLYRSRLDLVTDLALDVGIRAVVRDPRDDVHRLYATARPSGAAPPTGIPTSPEQLIAFDVSDPDNVRVENVMSLPTGPSNLVLVPGTAEAPILAYTVSYDARKLYVIDVDHWREIDEIRTNRGPHWPVYDPTRGYLYLVDFSAMVVEVVDVDPTRPTFDHVIFTIGDTILPDLT